jgi:hypothetical protein
MILGFFCLVGCVRDGVAYMKIDISTHHTVDTASYILLFIFNDKFYLHRNGSRAMTAQLYTSVFAATMHCAGSSLSCCGGAHLPNSLITSLQQSLAKLIILQESRQLLMCCVGRLALTPDRYHPEYGQPLNKLSLEFLCLADARKRFTPARKQ